MKESSSFNAGVGLACFVFALAAMPYVTVPFSVLWAIAAAYKWWRAGVPRRQEKREAKRRRLHELQVERERTKRYKMSLRAEAMKPPPPPPPTLASKIEQLMQEHKQIVEQIQSTTIDPVVKRSMINAHIEVMGKKLGKLLM